MKKKGYKENPFMLKEHEISTRNKSVLIENKNMAIVDLETKEMSGIGMVMKQKVDTESFLKIFEAGIEEMMELNSFGIKMFKFIFRATRDSINKDKIWLSYTDPEIHEKMSESSFHKGKRDLIKNSFIAPCIAQGWFWINPSFIFNGNRLTMVKQYEIENREKNPPKAYEIKDVTPQRHEAEQFTLPNIDQNPYEENGAE